MLNKYKHLSQIWGDAMAQPTLDQAKRFAETNVYDFLRGIGLSMRMASETCDEFLSDLDQRY